MHTTSLPRLPRIVATVVLLGARAASGAGVAPIDLNPFHPAPGVSRILTVDTAEVGRPFQLTPQLVLHFADLPLAFAVANGPRSSVVENRATAEVSLAFSLWTRIQLSVALPVTVYQGTHALTYVDSMSGMQQTLPSAASAGLEDLRFGVKARFWSNAGGGVGAAATVAVPTGDANSYLGSGNVTGTVRLIGHVVYRRLTVALNAGFRWAVAESTLLNLKTGNSFIYGLGLQVELYRHREISLDILGEICGLVHASLTAANSPVEALFALKANAGGWGVFAGAGPGLSGGYGEPRYRVMAGLVYAWAPQPEPPAQPGSPSEVQPQAKPQPHARSQPQAKSQPRAKPQPQPEAQQAPVAERRPQSALPAPPTPAAPQTAPQAPPAAPPRGPAPAPAAPEAAPPSAPAPAAPPPALLVAVPAKGDRLNLLQPIQFLEDSAAIGPPGRSVLDQAASAIKQHREIGNIRIEGYSDDSGDDGANLFLSLQRAKAVRDYLVEHGVPESRLAFAGYGRRCPRLADATGDERTVNRRIAMVIVAREKRHPRPGECPAGPGHAKGKRR